MKLNVKLFYELSLDELYQILQLRNKVFIVEQESIYLDIDELDKKATHLFYKKENKIIAYTRIFDKGTYKTNASISRVVVDKNERKDSLGKKIMFESIEKVFNLFETSTIEISAQYYLLNYYNNIGFKEVGEFYIEDGIKHIKMLIEKNNL